MTAMLHVVQRLSDAAARAAAAEATQPQPHSLISPEEVMLVLRNPIVSSPEREPSSLTVSGWWPPN